MKIKNLILGLFLVNSLYLSAQQNIFIDIEASTLFMQEAAYQYSNEFTYFQSNTINDTTLVRSNLRQESTYRANYNPELGFEIRGNVNFNLAKNLRLRTGLAFNLMQFSVTQEFVGSSATLLSIDTITVAPVATNPLGSFSCSTYSNSISDVGEVDGADYYDILALRIPVEISYTFFNSKANIGVGGYLQTPIHNRFRTEYLNVNRVPDANNEGQNVCSYERVIDENTFGEGIQSLSFGLNVSFAYQIERNLDVQLSLQKDVTNTFHDDFDLAFTNNQLFPTRLAVGLRYSFVGNESVE